MTLRRLLKFVVNLFKLTAAQRKDLNEQMAFDRSQSARRRAAGLVGQTPLSWERNWVGI